MKNVLQVAHLLFKKPLEECTAQEVKDAATKYPYFGPLQGLLLQKLTDGGDDFIEQRQRSAMFFPSPAHMQYWQSAENFQTGFLEADIELNSIEETASIAENNEGETVYTADKDLNPVVSPTIDNSEPDKAAEPSTYQADDVSKLTALPVVPSETLPELTFEPYHTVDYFASQGIKLSAQDLTTDKFGKQLKSFTAWLKTMKRLPQQEVAAQTDPQAERNVSGLANQSLAEAQVVTESMAEVWEKQGNRQMAIEVYQKLSLLNPSKLAYFAAKIEALNSK